MPSAQTNSLSLGPAKRGWMNDNQASCMPPVGLVELMRALAVVRAVASNHPGFAVGTLVGPVAKFKGAPVVGIAGAGKPLAAPQQRAARRFQLTLPVSIKDFSRLNCSPMTPSTTGANLSRPASAPPPTR